MLHRRYWPLPLALLPLLLSTSCAEKPGTDVDAARGAGGEHSADAKEQAQTQEIKRLTEALGAAPGGSPEKLDVLFVIDNSAGMEEHQQHLQAASAQFIEQLVRPTCIDVSGTPAPRVEGQCPEGTSAERQPVSDLHVGVISSSLGGHGASVCQEPEQHDRALLIPSVRDGGVSEGSKFFVRYDGQEQDLSRAVAEVGNHIGAVGTRGCGFESQLESVYRFLVDPAPPEALIRERDLRSEVSQVDEELLQQRGEFLRSDSGVMVVLLSDEDDCSAMEGGTHYRDAAMGWLTAEQDPSQFSGFPAPSLACASDPSDACCYSCLQVERPAGCEDTCSGVMLAPDQDRANVRCFDQKRRFGLDLLFPTERYVDGLSKPVILSGPEGTPRYNPLFVGAGEWTRSPDWLLFTAIVGVPYQDLATSKSLQESLSLDYLEAEFLEEMFTSVSGDSLSRWEMVLGADGMPPADPFMIPSLSPRQGTHPLTGESPESGGINGGDFLQGQWLFDGLPANDELQYACTYRLMEPLLDCTLEDFVCECGAGPGRDRSICREEGTLAGARTSSQYFARAYPSPRILEVARALGASAAPASICPAVLDSASPDFGYDPALRRALNWLGTLQQ